MSTTADYLNSLINDRNAYADFIKSVSDEVEVSNLTFTELNDILKRMLENRNRTEPKGLVMFNSSLSDEEFNEELKKFDGYEFTYLRGMFGYCNNVTSISTESWLTDNAVNCFAMFANSKNLRTVSMNNSSFSSCDNVSNMFLLCTNLTSVQMNLSFPNVLNASNMFCYCINLSNIPEISLPKVENMFETFYNLEKVQNITISNLHSVISMSRCFANCSNLQSINFNNCNVSNITNLWYTFGNCQNLSSIDVSMFNVEKVTYFDGIFEDCSSLIEITGLENWRPVSGNGFLYMFANCTNLKNIDISNWKINIGNISNFANMFYNCNSLTNNDIYNIINFFANIKVSESQSSWPNFNLSNTNNNSPFYNTKFDNSYYTNMHSQLTNMGWTF